MTLISRLIAVSVFAVLVTVSSPVALSQTAQESSGKRQEFSFLLARAEKGDLNAQFDLAGMYYEGKGVPKNSAEAVKWYRRAANQGDVYAQYIVGLLYDDGDGVPKNDAEAVKWYRRAADQGDADAQFNLGLMYYNGEGVPKNDAEAYFWWNLAAAQGGEKEKTNRDSIEKTMTREQIAEAQRRSAAWKPKKE